jgi:hypothetical protein
MSERRNQVRPPKFGFYEKVRINCSAAGKREVNGALAAVLGMSRGKGGQWVYAVHVYKAGICWSVGEDELKATGEFDSRDRFYDGSSIKVKASEEEGSLDDS